MNHALAEKSSCALLGALKGEMCVSGDECARRADIGDNG